MNTLSRSLAPTLEPLAPRSLGTLAAAFVTCAHPESSHVHAALDHAPGAATTVWCASCGALQTQSGADAAWQPPTLTSVFTRKAFDDLVLLLHAVVQLGQLARAERLPGAASSPANAFLRSVRASLTELSRLPVVRDVDRLDEAILAIPKSPVPISR